MKATFALTTALAAFGIMSAAANASPQADKKKADDAAAADAAKGPKYNLSKPVQNAVAAAQTAIAANDLATANAKLAEADAALSTDDDRYVSARLHLQIAAKANDAAAEAKALPPLIASPRTTQEEKIKYLGAQAQLAAQMKDSATEQAALQQLSTLAPNDPNTLLSLADVANDQKNYPVALSNTEKAVAAMQAANQPVDPAVMHNLFAYAYNAHDAAAMAKYGPMLISTSPTAENWKLALGVLRQQLRLDDAGRLDFYRLLGATNGFSDRGDYTDYIDLADRRGLPGEVVSVAALAQKGGVALDSTTAAARQKAASQVTGDKAGLAASETKARAGATGQPAANTADAYLSYGEWQKAADLYGVALQKGGVDAPTVETRLGIALARAGQKDQAKAAFAKVTGPRAPLATYWSLWADHPAPAA